ncbi:aromatic ring-hydroxylating dioxygenase subunit alpha [Pigmentiphaga kullae]|uniref:Phenylpropionate dioxygenase-like ring-hydroxylating dioxygenase large terminal subunit n=1 Tax=Pigmentiphaga kullae TaxID=151784 RepID=A0A4Q7N793_9BURK|nr:aromatic ring-hydroxylating dioxygenase subunit alpha [Pigmentiphaga kullae]RZS77178.1 phenylpropionate dioxygenase-like ring-hydroxylating dioxygenase large terminal subunit [Pigmentiphaga kullae]
MTTTTLPDAGTAYERKPATYNATLTQVGRGTPMGELLRRYWHPIGVSADASEVPRKVRVLGEDLILFRDGQGRPGLLYPHCAHRGTSLYYGRVEGGGIRCCYHGWLFDVQGHCTDQPCEPQGGLSRDRIRQPWYPVEERYGLIFAYMGPPDRKPVLPRYAALEDLAEGEFIEANDQSIGGGGPQIIPCNWLQHFENVVDPFHVVILHSSFSGTQFVPQMGVMPEVAFDYTDAGVSATAVRRLDDGKTLRRVGEAALPTLRVIPSPRLAHYGTVESLGWVLPIDDTSFRIYTAGRVRREGDIARSRSRMNGKLWEELTEAEHQRMPGDYEAQVSQGPIAWHSEENLTTSDRGLVLLRRMFKQQLDVVAAGGDPVGVNFDRDAPPIVFAAGNFLE